MKLPSAEIVAKDMAESDSQRQPAPPPGVRGEGIPWQTYKRLLRDAGLRPTRARMILSWFLFGRGNRHVTAEMLYEEAIKAKVPVSLATVYNTLNQFTDAGLLRQIGVDGSKSFFDTNPSEHHHFFVQGEDSLLDIPATQSLLDRTPEAPDGFEIARIDVLVRLRRKGVQD